MLQHSQLDSFSLPGEDVEDDAVALARIRRAEMVKALPHLVRVRQAVRAGRFFAPTLEGSY